MRAGLSGLGRACGCYECARRRWRRARSRYAFAALGLLAVALLLAARLVAGVQ